MTQELSEVNDYESLRQWLNEHCKARHTCWHDYGPADYAVYLADPVKILLIGAESYDYGGCESIPPNEYLRWIEKGDKTPRYSSVFVAVIREYIEFLLKRNQIPQFDRSRWCGYYRNHNLLKDRMCGTIYMNARVTSNDTGSSREDRESIMSDVREFAAYRKRFIDILRPRILICAGVSAKCSLFTDGGAFPVSAWRQEDAVFVLENYVLVNTPHLSRPTAFRGYENLHKIAVQGAKMYVGKYCSDI
jgi:hypothetical protein